MNRHFVVENAWMKREDDSYVSAWRPYEAGDEFDDNQLINIGKNKPAQLIKSESRGYAIFQNIEKKYPTDEASCKVTFVIKINLQGSIPSELMNRQIPRSVAVTFQARKKFNKDDLIDRQSRHELSATMSNSNEEYVNDSPLSLNVRHPTRSLRSSCYWFYAEETEQSFSNTF